MKTRKWLLTAALLLGAGYTHAENHQMPTPSDYMVIALSGGTGASNYPVTYLADVPPGGWTDTYKTTNLVMRKIYKGTFMMGGRSTDYPGAADEGLHQVTLTKDFYMGVFEVTQRQWELVMGNRPSWFKNETYYATRPVERVSYYDIRANPSRSDDPAVNWPANSAVNLNSFMGKLRTKTALTNIDLPTESQWEYACRAGTTTALNTGYNLTNATSETHMDSAGRYRFNGGCINDTIFLPPFCSTNNGTAKVGSYLPNAWGLFDMHGNVWERCLDWYGRYPGTATDPLGAKSLSERVERGGCFHDKADGCRSAYRQCHYPDNQFYSIGFRVAMTLP